MILNSVANSGFNVDVFVPSAIEPTIEQVHEVIDAASKKDYGLIVGIDGGSSLDRAKMAACFADREEKIDDYLPERVKALPRFGKYASVKESAIKDYDAMLEEYYSARGWDKNGILLSSKLKELGLEWTLTKS